MSKFRAKVRSEGQMNAFIELPEAIVLALGAGKRPPLKTTINGVPYRTRVAVYSGRYFLGLRKDIVRASGATSGSMAQVSVELDKEPRDVQLPSDLAAALAPVPEAKATFDGLAFTHRKEYVRWVEGAKREETRRARIVKAVSMLGKGVKTPG
jgi:Bacteriocin-protection, YdeI or OmpD-Associated/Domain of unknown function (DUF1905)